MQSKPILKILIYISFLVSIVFTKDNDLEYIFDYFSNGIPSDDPNDYIIDYDTNYFPQLDSMVYWLIPDGEIPIDVKPLKSNNNVAIEFYHNRIFVAFRSSSSHFANSYTKMIILSTKDGKKWEKENVIEIDNDVREPLFAKINGRLMFYYFKAGNSSIKFEPTYVYMKERIGKGEWSKEKKVSNIKSRVFWNIKNRNDKLYVSSYEGEHYKIFGKSDLKVRLLESIDGTHFSQISSDYQYIGGISEVAFEFDEGGNFWAISRNEDGDGTGFGSHLIFADNNDISKWRIIDETNTIYMSPRMFRHGKDIYLIARRNKGFLPFGFMPKFFPTSIQRIFNWLKFTTSSKATSLYKINQKLQTIEYIFDFPSSGDTAFPSIRRLDADTFVIANYTSNINNKRRWWFWGQIRPTYIYFVKLKFEKNVE